MTNPDNQTLQNETHRTDNPWLNLGLNVIIPSVIMIKFTDEQYLGNVWGLIIALAFPISYGLYDYLKWKKANFFSILGLISVLLTGGIGLFQLSRNWMIIKETAIPAIMGIVVFASGFIGKPLVKLFLKQVMDIEKIDKAFIENNHPGLFEKQMLRSNLFLSITFFISAFLNYYLAEKILVGEPGTTVFNESLGRMTFLSFPVITLPMVVMVMAIILFLAKSIKDHTGLQLEDVIKNPGNHTPQ